MSGGFLFEIAAKSAIVLLLAWAAATATTRRSSAAVRHLIWAAALVGILLLPVAVAVAPGWYVGPVLSRWIAGVETAATRRADVAADAQARLGAAMVHAPNRPASDSAVSLIDPEALFGPMRTARAARTAPWPVLLTGVWVAGVLFGVLRLIVGLAWASWIVRRAMPIADRAWKALAADAAARLGLKRGVPLFTTDRTDVPVACGIVRPKLLLPVESEQWSSERRLVVLLHELAHVKRADCLVQALAQTACAMYWFNPLALFAVVRLRAEQERACDDLVLTAGTTGPDYADHLCAIADASRSMRFPGWATLAMARSSRLEGRVRAILDESRSRRPVSVSLAALVAIIGCAGVATLGAVRPSSSVALTDRAATLEGQADQQSARSVPRSALAPVVSEVASLATQTAAQTSSAAGAGSLRALVNEYCVACHNEQRRTAGVSLQSVNLDRIGSDADLWEKSLRKLRSGTHPPTAVRRPDGTEAPRLDKSTSDAFISALEAGLDREDAANWGPGVAERISSAAVAARVAMFLWKADPDEELLAASGRLNDPAVLGPQVRRMLDDERAKAFLNGFFGEWLYIRNIGSVKPDPAIFPGFDESLRDAFKRETELFIESQVRDDRTVTELLTANYTFLNDRLARHYGVPDVTGSEFRRVTVPDQARAGLLGQGSVLTVTSYANRTSPVLRGKWVLETLLGAPPPPPPANVPAMKENDTTTSGRTRLEESVKNPVCKSCHSMIDPIGFALENFDAIGQWRNTDGAVPVDASGSLADSKFNGPAEFRTALLMRHDAFVHTLTARLLGYALGRGLKYYDMPAVRTIVRDGAPGNHRWSALIAGAIRSTPFQMDRVTP